MSEKIRIVAFTGNKRQDSYNKAALEAALSLLPEHAELEIVSVDELPTYELNFQIPESARLFREKLQQADAVLIASPEYKGLLPPGLKNALSWAFQYESVLAEKPTALLGIGRQSETEQQGLRYILAEQQVALLDAPSLYVSSSEKFDRDGKLAHEETRQQLRALLASMVAQVRDSRSVLID